MYIIYQFGDNMDQRSKAFAYNRIKKPLFHYYGMLSNDSMKLLLSKFSEATDTLTNAMQLRDAAGITDGYEEYIKNYRQFDIHIKDETSEFGDERDYSKFYAAFEPAMQELTDTLQSILWRCRYATIEPNDILGWHVDQPTLDRFCVVLEGEQMFEIKDRKKIHSQRMLPGQIWFINSSWEHRVINSGNNKRLALLGCFEYNYSKEDNK